MSPRPRVRENPVTARGPGADSTARTTLVEARTGPAHRRVLAGEGLDDLCAEPTATDPRRGRDTSRL
ncbi:hypothetical protein ACIBBD_21490 [Streptomyces sp. NPDC051315]|uniref:hypothetical protein n=1 Tax=Streptomyces sp. NPDC051315 TaxID=3365650 RepID=UPI003788640C